VLTSVVFSEIPIFFSTIFGQHLHPLVFLKMIFLLQDVALGGWVIKRSANGTEVVYKFHRTFVLKPGKVVTVIMRPQFIINFLESIVGDVKLLRMSDSLC